MSADMLLHRRNSRLVLLLGILFLIFNGKITLKAHAQSVPISFIYA